MACILSNPWCSPLNVGHVTPHCTPRMSTQALSKLEYVLSDFIINLHLTHTLTSPVQVFLEHTLSNISQPRILRFSAIQVTLHEHKANYDVTSVQQRSRSGNRVAYCVVTYMFHFKNLFSCLSMKGYLGRHTEVVWRINTRFFRRAILTTTVAIFFQVKSLRLATRYKYCKRFSNFCDRALNLIAYYNPMYINVYLVKKMWWKLYPSRLPGISQIVWI